MMNKQPSRIALSLQQEHIHTIRVRRIVENLMIILNIPDGSHLINIFGDGHEADNREALATWVAHLLPDLDGDEVELRTQRLSQRAKQRISHLGGHV